MKRKMFLGTLVAALAVAGIGLVAGTHSPSLLGQAGEGEYSLTFNADNHIDLTVYNDETTSIYTDLGNLVDFDVFGTDGVSQIGYTSASDVLDLVQGGAICNISSLSGLLRLEGAFTTASPSQSVTVSYGLTDGTDYTELGSGTYTSFPIALPDHPNYFKIASSSSSDVHLASFKVVYSCSNNPASSSPLIYKKNSEGTGYAVTGYDASLQLKSLVIPDTYLGLPVVSLPDNFKPYFSTLQSITIGKNVASIGAYCFTGMAALTTIHFATGSALTSLGNYAFSDCALLASIDSLPSGVTEIPTHCFYDDVKLKTVTSAGSIDVIDSFAFYGCTSLNNVNAIILSATKIYERAFDSVAISGSVTLNPATTVFKYGVFNNAQKITYFYIDNNTATGFYMFGGCIYSGDKKTLIAIPAGKTSASLLAGTTTIDPYAANSSTSLLSVALNDSTTSVTVSDYAFALCSAFDSFDFSTTVYLGQHAFEGTALTTASFSRLTSIYAYAFADCASLATVSFPETLSTFSNGTVFKNDYAITNFSIAITNTVFKLSGNKILASADGTILYAYLPVSESASYGSIVALPSSLTTIKAYAFTSNYISVEFSSSITTVEAEAFASYYGTKIILGSGVNRIDKQAFDGCPNLTTVYWASGDTGFTALNQLAFASCPKLETIVLPASLTSVAADAFGSVGTTVLTSVYFGGTQAQWAAIGFGNASGGLSYTMTPAEGVLKLYSASTPSANPGYYWHYDVATLTYPVLYA
jgi:hypothetical protein